MANAKTLIDKAKKQFDKQRYHEAIKTYKDALEIEPENVDVLIEIGLAHRHLEQYAEAIMYYEKALKYDPKNKVALNNIGYARECGGDLEGAKDMYLKSLEIDPAYEIPLVNLAKIYNDNGRWDKSIEIYKDALEIEPFNVANWIDLGRAYRFMKDYHNAIKSDRSALKLDPNSKIAWNNLGFVYYKTGEILKAIEAYSKSLKIDWLYDLPYSNLINLHKELIKSDEVNAIVWLKIADAFFVAREYRRALHACNRALEINSEVTEASELYDKILEVKTKIDMRPYLEKIVESALNLFFSIANSVRIKDIIGYIQKKEPDLIYDKEDIKFKIFEMIRDKMPDQARLEDKKIVFYRKPAPNTSTITL